MSSPSLQLSDVSLSLPGFSLREISLSLQRGEILVVIGPNGAGKSLLMELIAGFYRPQTGSISLGGKNVTAWPPEKRRIGFVFQNYALFPHLSVAQNVQFALDAHGCPKHQRARRATELLERYALSHLANRHPQELSGGEKQRVALARAMAVEPLLFLFDEPFAAVDENSRLNIAGEIRQFLYETGVPAIFVMHDLAESLALADKIAVMDSGTLQQIGDIQHMLHHPKNAFVAQFIGTENILDAVCLEMDAEAGALLQVADHRFRVDAPCLSLKAGEQVKLCIRPEAIEWESKRPSTSRQNALVARVATVRPYGPLWKVIFDSPFRLTAYALAQTRHEQRLEPGRYVPVHLASRSLHVIPNQQAPL